MLLVRDNFFRETLRYSLQGAAIAMLFVGLYHSTIGGICIKLLELPFLRWMGQVSYAAYLWHLEPLFFFKRHFDADPAQLPLSGQLLFIAIATAITFFVSYLLGKAVAPVVRLRSRLHPRGPKP